ncbi:MAG TPA: class I tRNA ligase family protein, partial [Bacilli bacterium]|nr:class I tRNA ligase family protein [Bacilli bacterium]
MKKKTCYVTTPIYYSSGEVHIGNSYSTIVCDVFARYNRLKGHDTFFLTGMDEHGQKVEEAAKKNNVTPQEFVNKMAEKTQAAWQMMKITNNDFICTSQERHIKVVQKIFEKLLANDDIYLGVYEGNYCVPCESFFPKSKLVDGNLCPDCHRPTTVVKEETYFLRLKKYEKQLLQFIKENPDFIQ